MLFYLSLISTEEDRIKFTDIYETYHQELLKYAASILSQKSDAEDAVHNAFVSVAENIEQIDVTISQRLRGFLITVVRNKAYDIIRRSSRYILMEDTDFPELAITYDGSNGLTDCMAKLPENYRSVILLKYHYGYKSREVAKILGYTEANVIKIDQRAKKKLQSLYAEYGKE